MPTRQLPRRSARSNKTGIIPSWTVEWTDPQGERKPEEQRPQKRASTYYGTEPVVEATFQCEMLLFTDWEATSCRWSS